MKHYRGSVQGKVPIRTSKKAKHSELLLAVLTQTTILVLSPTTLRPLGRWPFHLPGRKFQCRAQNLWVSWQPPKASHLMQPWKRRIESHPYSGIWFQCQSCVGKWAPADWTGIIPLPTQAPATSPPARPCSPSLGTVHQQPLPSLPPFWQYTQPQWFFL